MTAIEAHEHEDGNDPFELDGVLDQAQAAAAAAAIAPDATDDEDVDPALEIGRRLLALESGNDSQRHLARLLSRGLDLAEAVGRPRDTDTDADADADADNADPDGDADDGEPDGAGDEPGAYRIALEGVDAFESLISAAEAGKARAITDAYAHAREELLDPTLSPGQRMKHADGDHWSTALSCTQIVGADLSVILNQSPGFAKHQVTESTMLVLHMPHILARLEAGELTEYQQRQVMSEAAHYRLLRPNALMNSSPRKLLLGGMSVRVITALPVARSRDA